MLTDWVLPTSCANHACQNAFKWMLGPYFTDAKAQLKDLYMAIESLRRYADVLQSYVSDFVEAKVTFDQPIPEDDLNQFYAVLRGTECFA